MLNMQNQGHLQICDSASSSVLYNRFKNALQYVEHDFCFFFCFLFFFTILTRYVWLVGRFSSITDFDWPCIFEPFELLLPLQSTLKVLPNRSSISHLQISLLKLKSDPSNFSIPIFELSIFRSW